MAADEDLLREVADRSPDGLWITDRDGGELYCNATAARFVGEVGADGELDHDAMATLRDLREQALVHGAATDDLSSVLPDGRPRWVRAYVAVLDREAGDDVVVHRFSDVTDDRQLRHDLADSRRRLAAAQELTGASGWVWDIATDRIATPVLDADDPTGPERLVDITTYAAWTDSLEPEHRETVRRATADALGGDGLYDVVFQTKDPEGRPVWVHAHGVVERRDGVAVRVHGTFQDVTQIHEAEAELRRQVERTAMLRQVTATANDHRTFAEAAAAIRQVMLDSARCERMTVLALDDDGGLAPLDLSPTDAELRLARQALGPEPFVWSEDRRSLAFAARHDDVTAGVVVVTWVPGVDRYTTTAEAAAAVGAVLGRVAERERAEEVIERARDAAMSASRQKSEFLATMSHEIRTPLNGIIGLNDLLLRTGLDPEQLRLASGVQAASRALLSLISDVLDFSRIEEGHLRIERIDFELRTLLDQLARVLGAAAQERGVDLVLVCDDEVPAALVGDPTRLLQVLVNLVANAVKFTEHGQVVLRVGATPATEPSTVRLRLDVADTGIGVDPDLVPHLFEPFMQGDATTTRRFGGTGLGLAIVRRIVTALDGEVTYEPRPGGGSRFVVDVELGVSHLPLSSLDDYARTWLTGRRVLVVADDEASRDETGRQLAWWRLRPAVEGSERALAVLQQALDDGDPFDAVVISLPPARALDVAQAVAAAPRLDGAVMLVLAAPGTDNAALQEAGVSVTLARPVPGDLLRAQLLEHLAGVAPQPHERDLAPRRRTHRRLLVVEDNPVNQLVAAGLLESLGFDVDLAGDGAVALDMLGRASYDAVLMDVQMPVLDGYETTRRLRASGVTLPVVAMTASAVEGERERCLAAGMDDFLTKPVDPVDLAGTLERWLGAAPAAAQAAEAAAAVPETRPAAPSEEQAGAPTDEPAPWPPTPPIAGLDVERLDMLRDIDPGDTSYLDRAIGNFEVNSVAAVETIATLVDEGDVAAVRAAAHKIAGSALNLGAARAGEAARAVEQLADTGTVAGADELLVELAEAMAEARALLVTYRATFSD